MWLDFHYSVFFNSPAATHHWGLKESEVSDAFSSPGKYFSSLLLLKFRLLFVPVLLQMWRNPHWTVQHRNCENFENVGARMYLHERKVLWGHTWFGGSSTILFLDRVTFAGLLAMFSNFNWLWEDDGKVGSVFWNVEQKKQMFHNFIWIIRLKWITRVVYLHQFQAEPELHIQKQSLPEPSPQSFFSEVCRVNISSVIVLDNHDKITAANHHYNKLRC